MNPAMFGWKKNALSVTEDLHTLSDFIQYAARRFEAAGIEYGHGTDNPFDEAAFIVMEVMGLPPTAALEPLWATRLSEPERAKVLSIVDARIATRKPAPYLLNRAWFQGIPFYVDERVIVPRSFIGELLKTEGALPCMDRPGDIRSVLDLCTGSGCIAILAATLFPNADVDAVDLSPDALAVARRNVDEKNLGHRVHLYQGDLFAPLEGKTYDLILTNPPYVDAKGMHNLTPENRAEPDMALAAGADGLDLIRRIMRDAPRHLNGGGAMLCELGRCSPAMKKAYPELPLRWLNTKNSTGEVFWIAREELT